MRILIALCLLVGCASSTKERLIDGDLAPDKNYCKALKPTKRPGLSQALKPLEDKMKTMTGTWVLEEGASAMVSRAWLAENAEKSIDVQYFIFSADNVGLIGIDYLVRAASRGVKVRLLIDDLLYDSDVNLLQALDAHPNLEIKVYNPNLTTGKNLSSVMLNAMLDFRAVNQRMHNKTFIVDGKVVITGGRNIADEYFDFNQEYNFRDRDVLLLGGAASQVQKSFNQFWSHSLSGTVSMLMGKANVSEAERLWENLKRFACNPDNFWPSVRERIEAVPQVFQGLVAAGHLKWVEDLEFVSDDPGKNSGDQGLGGGGLSTSKLIELVETATKSVMIQTPYLVTTELSENLFAAAVKRGVEVTILTNSLGSTDGYAPFRGYQRSRPRLLKAGVKIYEFRPDAKVREKLMSSSLMKTVDNLPVFGLHAKTMVVDEKLLVVGTFNIDPRSANLNTECIVVIPSKELANNVLERMREEIKPENAYQVTKDHNGDAEAPWTIRFKTWMSSLVPAAIL